MCVYVSVDRLRHKEAQAACKNSYSGPVEEDLWILRVQGDNSTTQFIHCAVSTCAVALREGGLHGRRIIRPHT